MKNSMIGILPFLFIADLVIPFLMAPFYRGYHHLTQVMSVLGNSKAPLHRIYNIWLAAFGTAVLIGAFQLYPVTARVSKGLSAALLAVMVIYAVGGCILSGLFAVGETKSLESLSAKIHGYGAAAGFMFLTFAPLLVGIYFFKRSEEVLGGLSFVCFILAVSFFILFIMADKPKYKGTVIAFEGLWQRLSLLSMYLPVMALCVFGGLQEL